MYAGNNSRCSRSQASLTGLAYLHDVESSASDLTTMETDTAFAKLLAGLDVDIRLPSLHTLKLRGASLTDMSLNPIISMCPSLRRLDISFTLVKHPAILSDPATAPPLEKLSLTSTSMSGSTLIATIPCHPHLKTLSIGALGGGQATNATMGNSSGLTMTDSVLCALTDSLSGFTQLENVNLVGNAKLGTVGKFERALEVFIGRVGRKCKVSNRSALIIVSQLLTFTLRNLICLV